MSRNGFRLHSLVRNHFRSRFSDKSTLEKIKATELMSSDVLFLPTEQRLREMSDDRLLKLSYILHMVYGMHDMAYEVLCKVSPDLGESYLLEEGYKWPVDNGSDFKMTHDYSPDIWG